jgi:hypothetical protein
MRGSDDGYFRRVLEGRQMGVVAGSSCENNKVRNRMVVLCG